MGSAGLDSQATRVKAGSKGFGHHAPELCARGRWRVVEHLTARAKGESEGDTVLLEPIASSFRRRDDPLATDGTGRWVSTVQLTQKTLELVNNFRFVTLMGSAL